MSDEFVRRSLISEKLSYIESNKLKVVKDSVNLILDEDCWAGISFRHILETVLENNGVDIMSYRNEEHRQYQTISKYLQDRERIAGSELYTECGLFNINLKDFVNTNLENLGLELYQKVFEKHNSYDYQQKNYRVLLIKEICNNFSQGFSFKDLVDKLNSFKVGKPTSYENYLLKQTLELFVKETKLSRSDCINNLVYQVVN